MCTAIAFPGNSFYFGRTLDHTCSYGEEVVFCPRNFPLPFRDQQTVTRHLAMAGMAHVSMGYPLFYDAMNEAGLCMAALNFTGFARYGHSGRDRIAPFEFIPWILSQCSSVHQAKSLLNTLSLTSRDFSPKLPCARLHWIIADHKESITVESLESGLRVWDNPIGVLTNDPPFDDQLFQLSNFMHLSANPPENRFSRTVNLKPYSLGMGAIGLPGDLSSQSRFVRAAFTKLNAQSGGVSRFFRILDTVRQTPGCTRTEDGSFEHTLYTSCCAPEEWIYYYTAGENCRITAVDLNRENPETSALRRFPLLTAEDIHTQN